MVGVIWVDGDSCPREVKEFLKKTSEKRNLKVVLVSCQPIKMEWTRFFTFQYINPGPDAVDSYILTKVNSKDLVITRDIPLAEKLVNLGVGVLNDRGDVHSLETVAARKRERDLKAELRGVGLLNQPGRSYSSKEVSKFANALDREIQKRN